LVGFAVLLSTVKHPLIDCFCSLPAAYFSPGQLVTIAPLLASLRLIRHPFPITHIAVRLPLFATSQPRCHPSPTSPPFASLTRRQRHPPTTSPLAPTSAPVAHLIRYQPYPSRLHQQASSSPPVANRATRRRPRQQSHSTFTRSAACLLLKASTTSAAFGSVGSSRR
jgi:hypothetical protein